MIKLKRKLGASIVLVSIMSLNSLALSACQNYTSEKTMTSKSNIKSIFNEFEHKIAERMSLDIRYFCQDSNGEPSVPSSLHCRTALTELPTELATMISDTGVGGIVLFAENVAETEQVVTLTYAIQEAALKSPQAKPLIISMDQEGGRVARFAKMTGFAGNMAIGASYQQHGVNFATEVNAIIAKELKVLGINNNYAPVLDVNTNVDNPVINTRSYGESPQQVAELGVSAVNAIQAQGVMATLKHFPGHGNTHVDSHLGLPRVDHDRETIDKVDLKPFAQAIKDSQPAMIMTAHIQYPALDNSYFTSKAGDKLIKPATMSRQILTGLLREQMAFDGIIATDALDMAGIAHYFTEVEAVVETFISGADLAVMPFKVRTPADIENFYRFIKEVAQLLMQRIKQGQYSLAEFEQSITRLNHYKKQYIQPNQLSLKQQVKTAQAVIANDRHIASEQALADASITILKNNQLLPLMLNKASKIHFILANELEHSAMKHALLKVSQYDVFKKVQPVVSYAIAEHGYSDNEYQAQLSNADIFIATVDIKTASLVDLGGMDDLTPSYGSAASKKQKLTYAKLLKQQLALAKKLKIPSILIAKGSPYLINEYSDLSDSVLLNFDDRVYLDNQQQAISPGFNASLKVIFNHSQALGTLPVTLKN